MSPFILLAKEVIKSPLVEPAKSLTSGLFHFSEGLKESNFYL